MLQIVDGQWKDHLYSLDHLKEGIGLRGYGQRDPLVEYKRESFGLFQDMKGRVDEEMLRAPVVAAAGARRRERRRTCSAGAGSPPGGPTPPDPDPQRSWRGAAECVQRPRASAAAVAEPEGRARRTRSPVAAETGARRWRRHRQDGETRRAEGRPKRPVSVRQREEIQEVPRREPVGRHGPQNRPLGDRPRHRHCHCADLRRRPAGAAAFAGRPGAG